MTSAAVPGIKTRSPTAPTIRNRKMPSRKIRGSTRRRRSSPRQIPDKTRSGNARLSLSIVSFLPLAIEQHQRQIRPERNDYHGDQRDEQKRLRRPVDFRDVLVEAMAGDEEIQPHGR